MQNKFDYSQIKALTFDTGGTVLDWRSGIMKTLTEISTSRGVPQDGSVDYNEATKEYRKRALGKMLSARNPDFNIDDVHRTVLEELAKDEQHASWASHLTEQDRVAIAKAWHSLDAWPDFAPALRRLRAKFTVVSFTILSTRLILDTAKKNGIDWDCVISCEMIGQYKLLPESYQTTAKWLQLQPHEILMVAAHTFDLLAAQKVGYHTALVKRHEEWGPGAPEPASDPSLDIVVDTFDELADALGC